MTCGTLEIDILNSIWDLTSNEEDRDISIQDVYTTIKTVMDRLTVKSLLVRYRVGKKFFYKATMQKEEMALEAVKKVTDNFFNGNSAALIRFVESKYDLLVK